MGPYAPYAKVVAADGEGGVAAYPTEWTPKDLERALVAAAGSGRHAHVERLVSMGVPAAPTLVRRTDAPLLWAALRGDARMLFILLKAGASPDVTTARGYSALRVAVTIGCDACALELLAAGASCGRDPADGSTPLIEAAHRGRSSLVQPLLDRCDATARDAQGMSAASWAAVRADVEMVDRLLDAAEEAHPGSGGAELGLALVGASGDSAVVKHLIERDRAAVAAHGETAIVFAAAGGKLEVVRELRAAGVSANGAAAVMWDSEPLTIAPLGDDQTARGTALMVAAYGGHEPVIGELLRAGAKVDDVTCNGATALMWAAMRGHAVAVRTLLAAGAEVDYRTAKGSTALMLAARFGHVEAAGALLRSGASTELRDDEGQSARDLAEQSGSAALIALFAAHPSSAQGASESVKQP